MTPAILEMNGILGEVHNGFNLTDEMPFMLGVINQLDTKSWRVDSSTPYGSPLSPSTWTNHAPIVMADVPFLERVYAKLDETTEYKNALVANLFNLHHEHESLKEEMRDDDGNDQSITEPVPTPDTPDQNWAKKFADVCAENQELKKQLRIATSMAGRDQDANVTHAGLNT